MRILVVDDRGQNHRALSFLFKSWGFDWDSVLSGKEALEKAQKIDYDVILMDIQMPGLNGFDTTKQMRLSNITTPIIALTGLDKRHHEKTCLDAGMNDFLEEPFYPEELKAIIQKWAI